MGDREGASRPVAVVTGASQGLGLALAEAFHLLGKMPSGYPVSYLTVLGGVLLGLGAYINRACVFGAIARFGSGEWAYIATPTGSAG